MAAILMPDHLHVVFATTKEREAKRGNFSAALKRWMRQELKPSWKSQRAVSIGCCALVTPYTTNGFTFRKIQFVPGLCKGGKIGRIDMNLTKKLASGALCPIIR